jgi:phosphate-selective porin OprO/OprP
LRLGRYEKAIVEGIGNEYNEIYAGINIYFYGQKFKWQAGLLYTTMEDVSGDDGKYEGWGLSRGLRLYW